MVRTNDDYDELLKEFFEDHYDSGAADAADYDDYDGSEDSLYAQLHGRSPFSFYDILELCLQPTLKDGLGHVGKLICWCVVFRLLTQTAVAGRFVSVHLVSLSIGLLVATHFFYHNTLYMMALAVLSYLTLHIVHQLCGACRGLSLAALCLGFNLFSEVCLASASDWHQIRGAQMILSMKVISLGFDMDAAKAALPDPAPPPATLDPAGKKRRRPKPGNDGCTNRGAPLSSASLHHQEQEEEKPPSLLPFLGYAFCPGNCVFGPWVKYSDYLATFDSAKWDVAWFFKIACSLLFGFLFLTISTCWNPWLIPDGNQKWMLAYRDAMSFRASHYFVSYVSDASNVASGFGQQSGQWRFQVTEPHNIEVPRSLVEVVVSWNKPMHHWLKTYCFKRALPFGVPMAVASTYFASVALHGLNFQLAAVLFSLGFYTFTEHRLRKKLSLALRASVTARRESGTVFRHREGELLAIGINLTFGLLAMFHLSYLGVMFDHQESQVEGYSWRHTIKKWEDLNFASHWLILAEFGLMCVI